MNLFLYCSILFQLSFRLIVLLHEFLGHGLVGYVCGLPIYGFYVSYFGGAFLVTNSFNCPIKSHLFFLGAGCLAQTIVGSICLLLAQRYRRESSLRSFSLLFVGACMLLYALLYLISSIILSSGDGYKIIRLLGSRQQTVFVCLSIALACLSFMIFKAFGSYLHSWFHDSRKLVWTIKTTAVLGGVVMTLWMLAPLESHIIRPDPTNEEIKNTILMAHPIHFDFWGHTYKYNILALFGPLLVLFPGMLGLYLSEPATPEMTVPTPSWKSIFKVCIVYGLTLFAIFLLRMSAYCF